MKTIVENDLAYAVRDIFPVSPGHTLIIPRRHMLNIFEATSAEREALFDILRTVRRDLMDEFSPDGFNIGINEGTAAGQTVMHLHIHIVPRFRGDVDDPRGGVRGVIPSGKNYPG
jgi:diadenosine tetraphosphate (Ap4A) HIT family hydrolase